MKAIKDARIKAKLKYRDGKYKDIWMPITIEGKRALQSVLSSLVSEHHKLSIPEPSPQTSRLLDEGDISTTKEPNNVFTTFVFEDVEISIDIRYTEL